jgi:hypothetical protein
VAWLGNLLPPEYRASAAKSGALADTSSVAGVAHFFSRWKG